MIHPHRIKKGSARSLYVPGVQSLPDTRMHNRRVTAEMNRDRMATQRTAANLQMAIPKQRVPMGSLLDKGIPFNLEDPKERSEAVKLSRLYYRTHDLVPLLIDIYSRFPVVGLEFVHHDPSIEKFYTDMFLGDLNYEEFLPESLGKEYYIAGEVTALGHFNESLGIWSSEEILDPDMVRVTKSIFVEEERVQLLVKDLVERLRTGPQGIPEQEESPSERKERLWQYEQLVKNYPEFLKAAAQDDGLDISDALVSRIVNKASDWDLRGTPFLVRSFRTLMMEESLNAAQDAVCDRLYAPLILCTLGLENLGDGEPWIPDSSDLDNVRDDMQAALSADFKLMVHNMGLKVESVFGRETVPRFDNDYERIDAKLLQAWGIGETLIAGGSGGPYASSALNREVCEQLMFGFQNKIRRHIKKRIAVIAEAQGHFDYEVKGGIRRPLWHDIIVEDPETGEEVRRRVPKLVEPKIQFSTLNLRDEATERAFVMQLKQAGVPVSDKALSINIPIEFKEELERSQEETVAKMVANSEAMQKAQEICDTKQIPYDPMLAQQLSATLTLRQAAAQTKQLEDQAGLMDAQILEALQQSGGGEEGGAPPGGGGGGGAPPGGGEGGAPSGDQAPQDIPPGASGPQASGPQASGPMMSGAEAPPMELPRNRMRPAESDEMRGTMPRAARIKRGPSSYGRSRYISEEQVEKAVRNREVIAKRELSTKVEDLVHDPRFWDAVNLQQHEAEVEGDFAEILNGGAPHSKRILDEALESYTYMTGVDPTW